MKLETKKTPWGLRIKRVEKIANFVLIGLKGFVNATCVFIDSWTKKCLYPSSFAVWSLEES